MQSGRPSSALRRRRRSTRSSGFISRMSSAARSQLFLHEYRIRIVHRIITKRSTAGKAHGCKKRKRFWLERPRFEPHEAVTFGARLLLKPLDDQLSQSKPACAGRDIDALHFGIAVFQHDRTAAQGLALDGCGKEPDIGTGEPVEIDQMIALGRVEGAHISVKLMDESGDARRSRISEANVDCV